MVKMPSNDQRIRINRRLIISLSLINIALYPTWIGFRLFFCWNEAYCSPEDAEWLCYVCNLGAVIAAALVLSLLSLIAALADLFMMEKKLAAPNIREAAGVAQKARRTLDFCIWPVRRVISANAHLRERNADPDNQAAEGLGWFTLSFAVVSIFIGVWILFSDFRLLV